MRTFNLFGENGFYKDKFDLINQWTSELEQALRGAVALYIKFHEVSNLLGGINKKCPIETESLSDISLTCHFIHKKEWHLNELATKFCENDLSHAVSMQRINVQLLNDGFRNENEVNSALFSNRCSKALNENSRFREMIKSQITEFDREIFNSEIHKDCSDFITNLKDKGINDKARIDAWVNINLKYFIMATDIDGYLIKTSKAIDAYDDQLTKRACKLLNGEFSFKIENINEKKKGHYIVHQKNMYWNYSWCNEHERIGTMLNALSEKLGFINLGASFIEMSNKGKNLSSHQSFESRTKFDENQHVRITTFKSAISVAFSIPVYEAICALIMCYKTE